MTRTRNEWLARRRKWLNDHPPNHQGYYVCYLCRQWVHKDEVTIDHVQGRGRTPKAAADSDENLKPAHGLCNYKKGSSSVEEMKIIRGRSNDW